MPLDIGARVIAGGPCWLGKRGEPDLGATTLTMMTTASGYFTRVYQIQPCFIKRPLRGEQDLLIIHTRDVAAEQLLPSLWNQERVWLRQAMAGRRQEQEPERSGKQAPQFKECTSWSGMPLRQAWRCRIVAEPSVLSSSPRINQGVTLRSDTNGVAIREGAAQPRLPLKAAHFAECSMSSPTRQGEWSEHNERAVL